MNGLFVPAEWHPNFNFSYKCSHNIGMTDNVRRLSIEIK